MPGERYYPMIGRSKKNHRRMLVLKHNTLSWDHSDTGAVRVALLAPTSWAVCAGEWQLHPGRRYGDHKQSWLGERARCGGRIT